jgi:hypothetical protein
MTDGDTTLSFLFSRANRPYTIAIIVAVLALVAFLVLDAGAGGSSTATTAAGTTGATDTTGATVGALTTDDCLSASQAMASAAAGIGGTALDKDTIDDAFDRMAQAAPTAIQADLAVMSGALDDFFATLTAAGVDLTDPNTMASEEAQAALTQAGEDFDASGFEDAATRVEAWFETECAEVTG